jgi:hypothetical protein
MILSSRADFKHARVLLTLWTVDGYVNWTQTRSKNFRESGKLNLVFGISTILFVFQTFNDLTTWLVDAGEKKFYFQRAQRQKSLTLFSIIFVILYKYFSLSLGQA